MNGLTVACTARLGAEPERKFTRNGKGMLTFSCVVDQNTTATENRPAADAIWLRCTVWEPLADELAGTLKKGHAVYLEGRLSHGTWETAAGERRCGLNVSCWRVDRHGAIGKQRPPREAQLVAAGNLATSCATDLADDALA